MRAICEMFVVHQFCLLSLLLPHFSNSSLHQQRSPLVPYQLAIHQIEPNNNCRSPTWNSICAVGVVVVVAVVVVDVVVGVVVVVDVVVVAVVVVVGVVVVVVAVVVVVVVVVVAVLVATASSSASVPASLSTAMSPSHHKHCI